MRLSVRDGAFHQRSASAPRCSPCSEQRGVELAGERNLLPVCRPRLLDLSFHGLEVEARARLHRRELDRRLRDLRHFLLHELEAPELVKEPVVVRDRPVGPARHAGALVRVEAKVGQDRPVDFDRSAQPALRLIGEPVFEVVDPHRRKRALGEVEDLVACRWALAGDQIHLVVAVQVHLVRAITELLALQQLIGDVGVAGCRDERREPVQAGHDRVLDLARRHLARPAQDHRHTEATLEGRALATGERRLAAVWPGEVLGAVVGREADDGVAFEAGVLHIFHHRADDIVDLRHPGFLYGPVVLGVTHPFILR